MSINAAKRLKEVFKDDPETFSLVKRAALDYVMMGAANKPQSIQVMANQLEALAAPNGRLNPLAREIFTPLELLNLRGFGAHLKRIPYENAANPSGSAHVLGRYAQLIIQDAGDQAANAAGMAVGAVTSSTLAGAATRYGLKTVNALGKTMKESRDAKDLMNRLGAFGPPPPIVSPKAIEWGRAIGRAGGAALGGDIASD